MRVARVTIAWARALGEKCSASAASKTRARVSPLTGCELPFNTRETVVMDTFAFLATSTIEIIYDFGFWILDFGLARDQSKIQNQKSKINLLPSLAD
jgi:hypothetical protein